jgi:hypothetical protein
MPKKPAKAIRPSPTDVVATGVVHYISPISMAYPGPASGSLDHLGFAQDSNAALERFRAAVTPRLRFVEATGPLVDAPAKKRKRGPRPAKRAAARDKMKAGIRSGKYTLDQLDDLLQKELAAEFGVSRETACKALNEVLAEFRAPNRDK